MQYHMETNTLICLIKRLDETFGRFSLHQLLPETLPLCNWNLCFWTLTFLQKQFIFYKYLFRNSCNIIPSANKSRSYLHIIVSCCGLEFQFLSVPTHSRLLSWSTRSTFYIPNPPSPLGYNNFLRPWTIAAIHEKPCPPFHVPRKCFFTLTELPPFSCN